MTGFAAQQKPIQVIGFFMAIGIKIEIEIEIRIVARA